MLIFYSTKDTNGEKIKMIDNLNCEDLTNFDEYLIMRGPIATEIKTDQKNTSTVLNYFTSITDCLAKG